MSSFAEPTAHAEAAAGRGLTTDHLAPTAPATGTGWITFSGVLLIVAGFLNLVDGLWALDLSNSPAIGAEVEEMLWYTNSLETWGWIYTGVGIGLVLVGIGVLTRNRWARWIGVGAASASMVVNMMWVFVYPTPALIHVIVAGMVIYGLTADIPPSRTEAG
ncbi:MAG TPA: hypothetical protein VGO78_07340 [Acidimicrobiales bacterium]|jgi:hypothetical protein|nr:hypothetical protein [Acidimicrobiales bacterium]